MIKADFEGIKPFKYWIIDNYLHIDVAEAFYGIYPQATPAWYGYDNVFEKKRSTDKLELMPEPLAIGLMDGNSAKTLDMLEVLTGIDGLIPDPRFRGGGLHQIYPGGKLDIHIDFNLHPKLKLDRRLNAILYLNKNWDEAWGGHLELWNKDMTVCSAKIAPLFNRLVVFETNEISYHGHPEPLKCPEGVTRKSMAWYYYTNGRPEHEKATPHAAMFQKRPQDITTPEIEALRAERNKGHLSET